MEQNINVNAPETSASTPIVTLTLTLTDPRNGEVTTTKLNGEGVIFGLLKSEKDDGDGKIGYKIAAGAMGQFCNASIASTMDSIEEAIYTERPGVKMLRDLKHGRDEDPLACLLKALAGNHRGDEPDDDDDHDDHDDHDEE